MGGHGFKRGQSSPCAFYHESREIRAVIHGDDFTILGWGNQLDWFRGEIKDRFEVKFRGRMGPGRDDDKFGGPRESVMKLTKDTQR